MIDKELNPFLEILGAIVTHSLFCIRDYFLDGNITVFIIIYFKCCANSVCGLYNDSFRIML